MILEMSPRRPFSATVANAFFVVSLALASVSTCMIPFDLTVRARDGSEQKLASVGLEESVDFSRVRSASTSASAFDLAAAAYSALAYRPLVPNMTCGASAGAAHRPRDRGRA